jgi:hypothetical protein
MPVSFADPQTVTIDGVTSSLPRVSVGNRSSEYQSADGTITLKASSSIGNRIRRVVRLDHKKVSADAFLPETNVTRSMSCYLVFDLPPTGYTNAEALAVYDGLRDQLAASSDALITKLLGGES